jgi:thiol:disulfide interchange protein
MKMIGRITVFLLLASASLFAAEGWMTDLEAAFAKARKEKKPLLVEFTGSDWCQPCIEMRRKVFSKKDFIRQASRDFILVELDFPNNNSVVKERNAPYAKKYKIDSFPTVLLIDERKNEFDRFPATQYPTLSKFLAHLKSALKKK